MPTGNGLGAAVGDADAAFATSAGDQPVQTCLLPNLHIRVVRSDTGAPVEGADVQTGGSGAFGAQTGADGFVRFDCIVPGFYSIEAPLSALDEDFRPPDRTFASVFAGTVVVELRLRPRLLDITSIDDHFVPGAEQLDLSFDLQALDDKEVTFKVFDRDGTVVFERALLPEEKADGSGKSLSWDGRCSAGPRPNRLATPLMAPFRAELSAFGRHRDEETFKILYESIVLRQGPWTDDEQPPDRSDCAGFAAFKLNELGYWGGPVTRRFEKYLDNAVIRYKANHPKFHQLKYRNYTPAVDDALLDALTAGERQRQGLAGDGFTAGGQAKVFVEEITYERGEFGSERTAFEKQRVNRPLIPVQAIVMLRGKADDAVESPDAVGPVRINWRFEDADEDLSTQFPDIPTAPSKARRYIEKALKIKGGRTGNGDNCPKDAGGIREGPGTNYRTPFVRGTVYEPYTVQDDQGQKVVFTRAWDDETDHAQHLGRAGVAFRPSFIAGDDYTLRAEIDFKDEGNRGVLESFHDYTADIDSRIHAFSGTFTIFRALELAAIIEWPARAKPPATQGSHELTEIAAEFARASIELDTSGAAFLPITDAMDEPTYQRIMKRRTMFGDPKKVRLEPDTILGIDLPKQKTLSAKVYKRQLRNLASAVFDAINADLQATFSKNLRTRFPVGFFICTFFSHKAVDVQTAPGSGDTSVKPENAGYVSWASSIGLEDSVILYDMMDPDKSYYVSAHEMGHNLYLLHWQNTGESNFAHHDHSDRNCMMSYSTDRKGGPGHQKPGVYTPHFCGKCNLKLRGWRILSGLLPAR
jgi:hypothetical protein